MTVTDTAAVSATAPETSYELLDPGKIIVQNIRQAKPSQRFIDSIREFGVLQPIGVVRDPAGPLYLRFGGRRRQACIDLGCQVPAIVVNCTVNTLPAEIDRIFAQLAENDDREELNAGDRAAAVQELLDLGADEAVVTRKTGLSKPQIAAARKAAASETARTLASQYPLNLEQLAAVAEFEDDKATVKSLVEGAKSGPGHFSHALQRARDARAERELIDAHTTKLNKQGITVTGQSQHYDNRIEYWTAGDGQPFTPKAHKKCPGNVVTLYVYGQKVSETWYCTDPAGNGHKRHRAGSAGQSTEQAQAERQKVLAGNKKWRSAETVRRDWLRELLARPKVPDGALPYTLQALARSDHSLRYAMDARTNGKHVMARQLLGLAQGDGSSYSRLPEVYTAMTTASPQRAQVIALAIVLGAHEDQTSVHSWRTPTTDTADYLETLAGWGYELSGIERELLAAVRTKEAGSAAAVKEDQAAAAGHHAEDTPAAASAGQENGQ